MTIISEETVARIAQEFGLLDDTEDQLVIGVNKHFDFIYQARNGKTINFGAGLQGLENLQEHLMLFEDMHDLRVDTTIDILIDTRRAVIDYCLENHQEVKKNESKV